MENDDKQIKVFETNVILGKTIHFAKTQLKLKRKKLKTEKYINDDSFSSRQPIRIKNQPILYKVFKET
jgi:hypothetical protein